MRYLGRIAQQAHVVCIQELHASEEEVLSMFAEWTNDWEWFSSQCENVRAGGVLTLYRKQLKKKAWTVSNEIFVDGRCLCTSITRDDLKLDVINIHNLVIIVIILTILELLLLITITFVLLDLHLLN